MKYLIGSVKKFTNNYLLCFWAVWILLSYFSFFFYLKKITIGDWTYCMNLRQTFMYIVHLVFAFCYSCLRFDKIWLYYVDREGLPFNSSNERGFGFRWTQASPGCTYYLDTYDYLLDFSGNKIRIELYCYVWICVITCVKS